MKQQGKAKKFTGKPGIESVTVSEKSVEVMFKNVRLVYDGISEVCESEFEGTLAYNFKAGLEIPEGKELTALKKTIRDHFKAMKLKGFAPDVAIEHFDEKKFKASNQEGFALLYPTSPAIETEDGFQPKGKLFVNPSHEAHYAGCYVDAKVAFVANTRGAITIKDYLNAIKKVGDGDAISGAQDPFGDSQSKATVKGVRRQEKPDEKPKSGKKPVKKK